MSEKVMCRDFNDIKRRWHSHSYLEDRESIYIGGYKYNNSMQITSEMENQIREIFKEEFEKFQKDNESNKTLPDFEVEKEIVTLYRTTDKPLFYVDIARTLNLPLKQVVKIVENLLDRGVIEEVTE